MLYACVVPHPPLVIPEVGGDKKIPVTFASYTKIATEINEINPEVLIVFSPHSAINKDYFHISPGKTANGDFKQFYAPQVKCSVEYDEELAILISKLAQSDGIAAGALGERDKKLDHGTMVPLYFLKNKKIVRIGLSDFSLIKHYQFGMCVKKAIKQLNRKTVIIASADMSHKLKTSGAYGFAPEGAIHDSFVKKCFEHNDFRRLLSIDPKLAEAAAECGLRSVVMLAGVMDGLKVKNKIFSYEAPYGVGYLCATVRGESPNESLLPQIIKDKNTKILFNNNEEDAFIKLARESIEYYVKTGKIMTLPNHLLPEMTKQKSGVFVSIKKNGNLRGCIGTITPNHPNIALEIIQNSVLACSKDSRFSQVTPDELKNLTYSVDILSEAEPIENKTELDIKKYGIIVTSGYKRGLLLPNLEGINSIDQQLSIAMQKGGIKSNDSYQLARFEVVRHK